MTNRQFLSYFRGFHSAGAKPTYTTNIEEIRFYYLGYNDKKNGYAFQKGDI